MQVVETREEARAWAEEVRRSGQRGALVPTMGSLHVGHTSLLEIAARAADRVALSIFVNPLQFGPDEDFRRYPRDLDADLELARGAGVDLVFAPSVSEVYPAGEPWIEVVPARGEDVLCGRSRPGHFRGVLTVVAKLFGIFRPDASVFGEKDFQQLVLIRRMVSDLDMGVEIIPGPIVRDADGLALSSRNRYLSRDERRRARALPAAIQECQRLFAAGEQDARAYREALRRAAANDLIVEYAEVVDADTLTSVERVHAGAVCAIAAHVGSTRLIDNVVLGSSGRHGEWGSR